MGIFGRFVLHLFDGCGRGCVFYVAQTHRLNKLISPKAHQAQLPWVFLAVFLHLFDGCGRGCVFYVAHTHRLNKLISPKAHQGQLPLGVMKVSWNLHARWRTTKEKYIKTKIKQTIKSRCPPFGTRGPSTM